MSSIADAQPTFPNVWYFTLSRWEQSELDLISGIKKENIKSISRHQKEHVKIHLIESLLESVSVFFCVLFMCVFSFPAPFFVASPRSIWQKTPVCQAGLLWDEPVNHCWRHPDNMYVKN